MWDSGVINQGADDVLITVGIGVLIARQFLWRSAQRNRMLRLPVLIIVAGLVYLVIELWGGLSWRPADWFIVAELGLVAITGTAMGRVTRFRTVDSGLQYRLAAIAIVRRRAQNVTTADPAMLSPNGST